MANVPQLFGAPAPQDTGGAVSSLMSAQMRGAEMSVQAAQQAVAQTAQALQFGLQLRARKDEQLREIEANSTLEKARQAAADERARLEREQQDRHFRASQRLQREGLRRDTAYKARSLNLDARQLDAQIGHQDRMYGLGREQFEEQKKGWQLDREATALKLREERQKFEDAERAKRYQGMAFELFMQNGLRQLPDGTVESDPTAVNEMLQRFGSGPRPGDVLGAAQAPDAGARVMSELERMAAPLNERAMRRTDQATDMLRASAAGGGGDGVQVQGAPMFALTPAAISALSKSYGAPHGALDSLGSEVQIPGRQVYWDYQNKRLVNSSLSEMDRAEMERFIASNRDLEAAFVGGAAAGFDGPQKQLDIGRSLIGGAGAQGGGWQFQPQVAERQQPAAPPSGQQTQAPAQPQGSAAERYFSRVGAPAPAEQPPGSPSSFMAVKQPVRGGRYGGSKDTVPARNTGRVAAPARAQGAAKPAPPSGVGDSAQRRDAALAKLSETINPATAPTIENAINLAVRRGEIARAKEIAGLALEAGRIWRSKYDEIMRLE